MLYYYYYFFKAQQHKAAGRKTRLDIQNYGCNGNLLIHHGVVERNRIIIITLYYTIYRQHTSTQTTQTQTAKIHLKYV